MVVIEVSDKLSEQAEASRQSEEVKRIEMSKFDEIVGGDQTL